MRKLLNLSEISVKYLLGAILIIVPLLPKFPLIRIPGVYVAIRFEDILMLILGLMIVFVWCFRIKEVFKDRIIQAIIIFFICGLVSLFAGAFVTQTLSLSIGFLHWARRVEYILPFLAVLTVMPKKDIYGSLNFFVKILMIVVLVAFVYGIGQRYLRFPVIITQNEQYSKGVALLWTPGSHINSTFAGHYDLAAFIVMVMPIFLVSLFVLKEKLSRLLLLATSAAGMWLLINSVSRMAQISYLAAISVALLSLKKVKAWILILSLSMVLMFMSSGLDARFTRAIQVIYQRVTQGKAITYVKDHFIVQAYEVSIPERGMPAPTSIPTSKPTLSDVSIAIRLNVEWPRAIRAFLKNPLLGTGYSSIGLAVDNDFLRVLAEIGILGFFAFVLMFFRIGKEIFKLLPLSNNGLSGLNLSFVSGFFGSLAGILLTALFIDIFEASKFAIIFWLMMGCVVALARRNVNEK